MGRLGGDIPAMNLKGETKNKSFKKNEIFLKQTNQKQKNKHPICISNFQGRADTRKWRSNLFSFVRAGKLR